MRGKLLFITGVLIGYVLGARAGRKRYEQIAAAASDLWSAKPVQRRLTEVRDFALETVGDVPAALFEAGKKVVAAVQGKTGQGKTVHAKTGQTKDASASASKTASAKTASAKTAATSASRTPAAKTAKSPAAKTAKSAAANSASADEKTTK